MRRIYSGIFLEEEERRHFEGFKLWLQEKNLALPHSFLDDHHYALRYLNSLNWDYNQTYEALMAKEKWLVEKFIPALEKYPDGGVNLQSAGFYGFGRDKHMRPIAVL